MIVYQVSWLRVSDDSKVFQVSRFYTTEELAYKEAEKIKAAYKATGTRGNYPKVEAVQVHGEEDK
jgi:hypothetical protein